MLQNITLRRITAWIAMVAVVFVMLFSAIYLPKHADHKCTDAECPVCALIHQCENNIKNIGTIVVAIVTAIFLCLSIQKGMQYIVNVCSDFSLISQKVRMNN